MPALDILTNFNAPGGVLTPYAPTSVATNIITTSVVDLVANTDIGAGNDVEFTAWVNATVTSGGSATVQIQLLGNATDPTFTSNNVVLYDTGAIAKATLVAGYRMAAAKIPRAKFLGYESAVVSATGPTLRYYTYAVIIATAALTAGSFNAYLTGDGGVQDNIAYPSGYSNTL